MKIPVIRVTRQIMNAVILILAVELALLSFFVYKEQSVIAKLSQDVTDRKVEIARYSMTYREIPRLQETLNSLMSQLEEIEWNLPSPAYIPTFLAQIEQWGRQCGVKITNISPQKAPPKPAQKPVAEEVTGVKRGEHREETKPKEEKQVAPYETISIELQVEGGFNAVQKFIEGFRRFPKAISLYKLDITPQVREEGQPLLRVSLSLNILVLSGGIMK